MCGAVGVMVSAGAPTTEVNDPATVKHQGLDPTTASAPVVPSSPTLSESKTLSLSARGSAPGSAPGSEVSGLPEDLHTKDTRASASRPGSPAQPPKVPGYEILDELGHGGMGVVYKARQEGLNRLVALKMILAGSYASSTDLARFRKEAEAVARLDHPGIVRIFEIGQQDGRPFFSLELVAGGSLADKLAGSPQPPREAARLVELLARAVHFAHENGIVHRDLKPGNILLTVDGQPKITDFGLAKEIGQATTQTQSGAILGTPSYMAPEQAEGRNQAISPLTDVYALGAILYEALSGRPPFQAATVVDTLMQVAKQEPVPLRELQANLPRDLETVCLKCLEKEPRRRYGRAADLAEDLRRFLDDKPIVARRAGPGERAWRWCRRNPVVASLAAGIGLLLLVIAVGASIAALWLRDERNLALHNLDRAEKAEKQVREKLWQSYLDQARASRWSRRAGRRFNSLAVLEKAAAIRPSLDLRNEAIASLALVDLRVGTSWEGAPPGTTAVQFAPGLQVYARGDDQGRIHICKAGDGAETALLQGPAVPVLALRFSDNGKYIAAKHHLDRTVHLQVWDVERRAMLFDVPDGVNHYAFDFNPDSTQIAAGQPDGSIAIHAVPSGDLVRRLPKGLPAHSLAHHPQGTKIAVSTLESNVVSIRDASTGLALVLKHPAPCRGLSWRGDGQMLATACANSRLYVWHFPGPARLLATLEGHDHVVTQAAFNHRGDLLASTGWDNTLRLWEPLTGKHLHSASAAGWEVRLAPDDRKLASMHDGSKLGYWEVGASTEFTSYYLGTDVKTLGIDFSPDGRLLAVAEAKASRLWDALAGKEVGVLPGNAHAVCFHPDGKSILTSGSPGVRHWPLTMDDAGPRVGPPRVLSGQSVGLASLSRDGRLLAFQSGNHILGMDPANPESVVFYEGLAKPRFVAVSPDGKWVAAGTWHGTGVKVWDAARPDVAHDLPARASAAVAFDQHSRRLVVSTGEDYQFWETATWKPGPRILRDRGGDVPGWMAFSPTGDMIAIAHSLTVVQLLDLATGKQIATLEPPHPLNLNWLCFSPDGARLAATAENFVHAWDLRKLRQRLAAMRLDWE